MRILLALVLAFSLSAEASNSLDRFKGKWTGFSTAIYSVYGNLSVGDTELIFEKKGKRSFKLLNESEGYVVLELTEQLDCGRFVRLGPIMKERDPFAGMMEFSVYDSQEKSMIAKVIDGRSETLKFGQYCVYGLYSR